MLRRDFLKGLAVASAGVVLSKRAGNTQNSFAQDDLKRIERSKTLNNPIFSGVNADPEVLLSRKTGRAYIYPTSNGRSFCTYSSDNLVDWKYEGIVLDSKDVLWEKKKYWAPSIIEVETEKDKYRYYFYYCANEQIGVAIGDDPAGPFVDHGRIVGHDLRPKNRGGVEIDPFVYHDPNTGKYYLYWGNSYLCVCELNDDMVSLKLDTLRDITPKNFFEGTYVFYRNNRYYLTWSKNPTTDPDYQVWVATSDSPLGPFVSPKENYIILSQRPDKNILGPGHHSFLFLPNGENYVFYHRFIVPQPKSGWGREVCMDRFDFAKDGAIIPIEPTCEGVVTPIDLKSLIKK